MDIYSVLLVLFAFGVIIGSFLNVVILRYDTGMPIARGRSKCFSCAKALEWYELLPVISFFAQRGKCRGCKSKISWQYPLVELATGLALVAAYLYPPFLLTAALLCLYVVIFVYDFRQKVIPDAFSYGAALVAFALMSFDFWSADAVEWSRVVAGPALFLFFWSFWHFSKGRWMGFGDAKLALSVGWALGFSAGVAAIVLAFWTGAIVSLALMGLQRAGIMKGSLGMRSEVPFGPFILFGFLVLLLTGFDYYSLMAFLAGPLLAV